MTDGCPGDDAGRVPTSRETIAMTDDRIEALVALIEGGPAAALGPATRSALLAVLTSPLSHSLVYPLARAADREALDEALRRLRVPPEAAAGVAMGLVE